MAYPQIHLHEPARYISADDAASHISTYLLQASEKPYLHPDAIFGAGGLQFGHYGGSAGGLVLHQLRRVEKGLRGERIAVDLDQTQAQAQAQAQTGEWEEGSTEGANQKQDRKRKRKGGSEAEAGDNTFVDGFSGADSRQDEMGVDVTSAANNDGDLQKHASALATPKKKSREKRASKRKTLSEADGIAKNPSAQKSPRTFDNGALNSSGGPRAKANMISSDNKTDFDSERYKAERKLAKKERRKIWKQQKAERLTNHTPQ